MTGIQAITESEETGQGECVVRDLWTAPTFKDLVESSQLGTKRDEPRESSVRTAREESTAGNKLARLTYSCHVSNEDMN